LPEHPGLGFGKTIDAGSNVDLFLLSLCKGGISSSGRGGQFAYLLALSLNFLTKTDFLSLQNIELFGRKISVTSRVIPFRTNGTLEITLQHKTK
jgi:hypothetical protein